MHETHETNGKQRSLREALRESRRELALARTQKALAVTRAETKLLEGWYAPASYTSNEWGGFVDPRDAYRDGNRWAVGLSSLYDRKDGGPGPFLPNQQQLDFARSAARQIIAKNPIAIGVLETVCDFVVGEGMLPKVTTKDRDEVPEQLLDEIQDVLDDFVDVNEFDEFQTELVARLLVDGEYFLRYCEDDEGGLTFRIIEPEYVYRPGGAMDEFSWGLQHYLDRDTGQEDVQRILSYVVHPHQSTYQEIHSSDWDLIPADEISHVKRNVPRNVKRGISDFYSTKEGFDALEKLLRNFPNGEAIRQAIAGIVEYDLAPGDKVQKLRDQQKDANQPYPTNPITGKDVNAQYFAPGTILHTSKNRKYQPGPVSPGGAQAAVQAIQAVSRALLVRWGMPEYFSGDASNANFASTLVAGSPFVRRVKRWQKFFSRRFTRVYWRAVRQAYDIGRFGSLASWDMIRGLVNIQVEGPSPTLANELQEAQVDDMDLKNGVLSKQTRRQRRGLDDEQERENLREEPVSVVSSGAFQQPGAFPQLSQGRVAGGGESDLRRRVVRLLEAAEARERGEQHNGT